MNVASGNGETLARAHHEHRMFFLMNFFPDCYQLFFTERTGHYIGIVFDTFAKQIERSCSILDSRYDNIYRSFPCKILSNPTSVISKTLFIVSLHRVFLMVDLLERLFGNRDPFLVALKNCLRKQRFENAAGGACKVSCGFLRGEDKLRDDKI